MSLYVLVGSLLYFSSVPQQRPQILFWLFVLYIPMGIQYALNVVNAIVWRTTRRISPIGDEIPTSPVLTQAHKLVMAGRIDEAVALYTNFYERRTPALAEVARLLKAEGRLDEAMAIYVDLVENHASDRVAWPEAVYTLGKIYETHVGKAQEAIKLYKCLLDEAPESRFTHLAGADMARLMIMDASFIKTLHEDDNHFISEDPFHAQRRNFLLQQIQQRERMAKANEEQRKIEEDALEEPAEDAGVSSTSEEDRAEIGVTVRGKTGIKKRTAANKKTESGAGSAKKKTRNAEKNTGMKVLFIRNASEAENHTDSSEAEEKQDET